VDSVEGSPKLTAGMCCDQAVGAAGGSMLVSSEPAPRRKNVRIGGHTDMSERVPPAAPQNEKPYLNSTCPSLIDAYKRGQFDPRGRS
jgi:hypothetical protein